MPRLQSQETHLEKGMFRAWTRRTLERMRPVSCCHGVPSFVLLRLAVVSGGVEELAREVCERKTPFAPTPTRERHSLKRLPAAVFASRFRYLDLRASPILRKIRSQECLHHVRAEETTIGLAGLGVTAACTSFCPSFMCSALVRCILWVL